MLVSSEVHLSDLYRIIDIPYAPATDEAIWHEEAVGILVPANDSAFPEQVQDIGVSVLREFPAEIIPSLLENATDPIILAEIRTLRKILMIGRDSVLLTTAGIVPDEAEPMFKLARTLGKVRDARGTNERHNEKAKGLVAEYTDAVNRPLKRLEPVTTEQLQTRSKDLLFPLLAAGDTVEDPDTVHEYRQDFRRVVHLGYISALVNPSIEVKRCLAGGKKLNELYGDYHDQVSGLEPVV